MIFMWTVIIHLYQRCQNEPVLHSLKERNLLVVAAAQAEEKERQQVQEEIGEVEQHIVAILPVLETCSNLRKQQVRLLFMLYSESLDI